MTSCPLPTDGGPAAGLDPGRSKCGLVLTDAGRSRVDESLVLAPEETWRRLLLWRRSRNLAVVVLGDGTGSRDWQKRLEDSIPVVLVNERGTTLEGRQRYWDLFPPGGWMRLLPAGLRQPPRDWDDVVAQVLLERWLERSLARGSE